MEYDIVKGNGYKDYVTIRGNVHCILSEKCKTSYSKLFTPGWWSIIFMSRPTFSGTTLKREI